MAIWNLSASVQGVAFMACTVATPKQGIDILPSVAQIIIDFNLNTYNNPGLISTLTQMWGSYNDKAIIQPRLQDLYTRRQVCQNLQGGYWPVVDYVQGGVDSKRGQIFEHLAKMYTQANDEIIRIEAKAAANIPIRGGQMHALPPVAVRPGQMGQTYPGGPWGPWRYRGRL